MDVKSKKILLVGLGILGGGLSMAKYLLKKGAKLTITDLRDKKQLSEMINRLPKNVKYTIGKHQEEDFAKADIIIFNPAVSILSPWAKLAKKLAKPYFNDYTFFLNSLSYKKNTPIVIGITGTRGKTTTSLWANHLLSRSTLGGNIPEKGLLKITDKTTDIFVLELSSFQLEYATPSTPAPHIAVITNVYNDHLNRYGKFDVYAKMKFNIFKNQTKDDFLILNYDEKITKTILAERPKSTVLFVSQKPLPKNKSGLYFKQNDIYFMENHKAKKVAKLIGLSRHEKANLLCAMLASHLAGESWKNIASKIATLPTAPLRQEVILEYDNLKIVNDSAGTSPDAVVAAIEKYGQEPDFLLITGGTDKKLDYTDLAEKINDNISPNKLLLLAGSGTEKLKKELSKRGYPKGLREYDELEDIVKIAATTHPSGTIVFSPGGSSFEKFKNEFDRGAKFTKYVKKYFIEKRGKIG